MQLVERLAELTQRRDVLLVAGRRDPHAQLPVTGDEHGAAGHRRLRYACHKGLGLAVAQTQGLGCGLHPWMAEVDVLIATGQCGAGAVTEGGVEGSGAVAVECLIAAGGMGTPGDVFVECRMSEGGVGVAMVDGERGRAARRVRVCVTSRRVPFSAVGGLSQGKQQTCEHNLFIALPWEFWALYVSHSRDELTACS